MALEQKLSLKLAQKLVMTPSLQQAIKLLQMTRLELEGVLNQELVENPILEEREANSDDETGGTEEAAGESEQKEVDEAFSEIDVEAYFGDLNESWEGSARGTLFEERQGPPLENTLTREADLYDQLLWQLHMLEITPQQREIAECIIGNLDPEGFLVATIEEIQAMGANGFGSPEALAALPDVEGVPLASAVEVREEDDDVPVSGVTSDVTVPDDGASDDTVGGGTFEGVDGGPDPAAVAAGYPRAAVEEALEIVRTLEPPGVGYWTLQESLLRQLDARQEPEDSLARRLVSEKWDEMTHRKFEAIAREFGIPLAERPAVELISSLDTRPGRRFDTERTHYVEPDVHVVKVGDEYIIQLNDNGLPRLRVSRAYRKMLQAMRSQGGSEAEARNYIKDKMRSAIWLIKSLDQRQRTIYKVSTTCDQWSYAMSRKTSACTNRRSAGWCRINTSTPPAVCCR